MSEVSKDRTIIMKDEVRRPIFISAIIYKLLNRLGLMN